MADVVRQIRHDLEQLEKAVLALGDEFNQVYDNYLVALRTSIQKQVVLACYHLCTQTYPERFLDLSFRQRETLQQSIQRCIQALQEKLKHAYVLGTLALVEEEEEIIARAVGRRRSLPSSDRSQRRRRRGDSRGHREFDNDPDDPDGPSIELIAISNLDGDDALEAAKDPFLAAALSEFADSLALDEDAILNRVKQELLNNATRSSSKSIDSSKADDDTNEVEDPLTPADESSQSPESKGEDSGPTLEADESADEQRHNASPEDVRTDGLSEVSSIALSTNTSTKTSTNAPTSSTPAPTPFPTNPDGKRFADCDELLTPDVLATRQKQLEENLAGFLKDLSKQVNDHLHKVGMIPKKIPGAVLRAALQTDMSSEFNGSPNVLNLLVEAEGKSKDSSVMRVTALRLRPQELEFSDPQLSACRSRIRELTGKLQTLGKKYHKKQRERAIAEAESAWRSSWYEHKA